VALETDRSWVTRYSSTTCPAKPPIGRLSDYFFNPAVQLVTTVSGGDAAPEPLDVVIRKRLLSAGLAEVQPPPAASGVRRRAEADFTPRFDRT